MSKISQHFNSNEFACPCCGLNYDFDSLQSLTIPLEKIRNDVGSPITITSGRRCFKHNDELPDSVPNSQHVFGLACDIHAETVSPMILAMLALRHGFRFIGIGSDYIHIDMRLYGADLRDSVVWHY